MTESRDTVIAFLGDDLSSKYYTQAHLGLSTVNKKILFAHAPGECAKNYNVTAPKNLMFRRSNGTVNHHAYTGVPK